MDDLSDAQLEYWGEEYRRLQYALPPGTTFAIFLVAPKHYRQFALNQLRDWHDNPRAMRLAHYSPICLN